MYEGSSFLAGESSRRCAAAHDPVALNAAVACSPSLLPLLLSGRRHLPEAAPAAPARTSACSRPRDPPGRAPAPTPEQPRKTAPKRRAQVPDVQRAPSQPAPRASAQDQRPDCRDARLPRTGSQPSSHPRQELQPRSPTRSPTEPPRSEALTTVPLREIMEHQIVRFLLINPSVDERH